MWVFYLISLPLALGMVTLTLSYFAAPGVPLYVLAAVGYAWFCSISIIIIVPADIWSTIVGHQNGVISFFWSWSYWSTFLLTWAVVPYLQGYEDAGDFTVKERLKTSIRENLVFYMIIGTVGLFGLILIIIMHQDWSGNIVGLAMACSNTFGLVTGAFLLGFGLSEIPKSIWRNADWNHRQRVLSHRVAKMALKLDHAHQELSNAIVVAQATSNQMSKRDPLRRCMDIIDNMLVLMLQEDPSFKPSGGRLGEDDMDYDTDEKTMAALRRQLRRAREEYYRCKSEYITSVVQALELEDTIKNCELSDSNGWKYVSSFRGSRFGTLGSFLDVVELLWRCILRKELQKILAVILTCMSAAILLAEATLLPSEVDLSLFSILIKAVGKQEVLVQIAAFVPLMYMCICTYYSLFKVGMLMFYSLTPSQTSSVSLLMICSMVARYAPPISYNFLNLIQLGGNAKTMFEKIHATSSGKSSSEETSSLDHTKEIWETSRSPKPFCLHYASWRAFTILRISLRMGNIDDAVPFFGKGFNKIYPLIMVIYTLLVASNFFSRMIEFFGSWIRFKFQSEVEDTDGLDPSGMIILQKERSWLEQGRKVGEQVIPLARNFSGTNEVAESCAVSMEKSVIEMKETSMLSRDDKESQAKKLTEESRKYGSSRETMANVYASIREQQRTQSSSPKLSEKNVPRASSLVESSSTHMESDTLMVAPTGGLASKFASVKTRFQNLRTSMGAKKFLPLHQVQDDSLNTHAAASQSLDEIFQRLKQHPSKDMDFDDDDFGIASAR